MFSPIILRLTQRHINRRLFQSVLFVLGVALGVAMMVAIDLANSSASRAFHLSANSVSGRATHQIVNGPSGIPSDVYRQIRVDLGLEEAAPVIEDYVRGENLGDQPLRLLGVDPFAEPPFRSYMQTIDVQGETADSFAALNAFIAEPNTILMNETLAKRFDIQPGDTVTLNAGGTQFDVRVVGILRPDDSVSEYALENLLLTDIATAQEIVGRPGMITRIDLILPDDYNTQAIQKILPDGMALISTRDSNSTIEQMTAAFELNLQALSLLALVVGVFLIYNTVTFSVIQRRPVIGVMRAVGATRQQIFGLVLGEAFLLGVIGTIAGLGLGIIFGRGAVGLVARTISDLYFTVNVQGVTVEPITLLKGAAIGLTASILAAVIPSFDATHTPPAGTMRRSDVEQGAQRLIPIMTGAAVIMNSAGVLLLQIPTRDLIISFGALFCLIVGGALFTSMVLVGAARLLMPVLGRIFGVLGRMAARSVIRSLSRTSIAVAALTVAVSVIVGVSVMIDSFRNTVSDWLETTLGADIYVSAPNVTANRATGNFDPAIVDQVAAVPGVESVEMARLTSVIAPDFPDLPPANLTASNSDITQGRRRFAWNVLDDPTQYEAALLAGQIMVSEPFAFRRGITPEDNRLKLLTDKGEQTFTVFGVYYDYTTDQGTIFMAYDVYQQYYDDPYISSLGVFVQPGADSGAIIDQLQTQTLVGTGLQVQAFAALRTGVFQVFDNAFAITVALRFLATLVAFIGILSALMSLQLEQTRQYGVMRAVGMTPAQLWQFTMLQTGLMGTVAGLMALPIGLVLAIVLVYVINVRSFGWTMQLYLAPEVFVTAFLVAVVAALAAGIYPAQRLSKLVTARALRSE